MPVILLVYEEPCWPSERQCVVQLLSKALDNS